MNLHELKPTVLSKSKKRVGRGISGKGGRTAGRGSKGQKARTGYNLPRGFEGGQTKLAMKLPKVGGFKSHKIPNYIIKTSVINKNFKDGDVISQKSLTKKDLLKNILPKQNIKILFDIALTVKVTFDKISTSKKVK